MGPRKGSSTPTTISPRTHWKRLAFKGLSREGRQSRFDVEDGGDVDDRSPKANWKRLADKARQASRQETTQDDDNAGCDFHDIMDINDSFADQAIDDLSLLDNSSFDEASSAPTREGQEGRRDEPDDEKYHSPPPLSRSTQVSRPTLRPALTGDQEEDYDVKNEVIKRANTMPTGRTDQHRKTSGTEDVERRVKPKPRRLTAISFYDTPGSPGTLPRRSHGRDLTAPIGLPGLALIKETSKTLMDLVEYIKKGDYRPVTRTLFRAVKKGSERAVNAILGILDDYKLDICDISFREHRYTASVLHVALLFNEEDISRLLITKCPGLISVKYSSAEFENQTAFHIAASKGQCEILELMLEHCGPKETTLELLNTKATGTYFTEEHQAGALALTAAVWGGHCKTLRILIEKGADLDGQVHDGNTTLHYIVTQSIAYPKSDVPKKLFDEVWNKCTIWWQRKQATGNARRGSRPGRTAKDVGPMSKNDEMILRVEAFRYLLAIKNDANQNILSLAVNLHSNLTKHILNIEHVYKQPQTKFGAKSWSTYDVTEVTSFSPAGERNCRYNPGSVLHILGHRTQLAARDDDVDKDLIEEEPIKSLLRMKWGTYRFVYIIWCLVHFLLMLGLSIVSLHLHKPKENKTTEFAFAKNATGNATYGAVKELTGGAEERHVHPWYLVFSLVPLIYLVLEIVDISSTGYNALKSLETGVNPESKRESTNPHLLTNLFKQWSSTGNAPSRIQLVLFCVFVEIWICLHMIRSDDQDIPLSLAMVFGWLFMVFFTRACRFTCRFSVMMQKMFFHDCVYFLAVYVFFWLAFSTAMHVLLVDGARPDVKVWNTLYGMLNLMTDAGEKSSGEDARIPAVGAVLLSVYAVVSVILLLNMLIAMMNTSYEVVKGSKTNIWRYQQLSIMLMLERRLWWWEWLCDRSQDGVWTPQQEEDAMPKRFFLEVTELTEWNPSR